MEVIVTNKCNTPMTYWVHDKINDRYDNHINNWGKRNVIWSFIDNYSMASKSREL